MDRLLSDFPLLVLKCAFFFSPSGVDVGREGGGGGGEVDLDLDDAEELDDEYGRQNKRPLVHLESRPSFVSNGGRACALSFASGLLVSSIPMNPFLLLY